MSDFTFDSTVQHFYQKLPNLEGPATHSSSSSTTTTSSRTTPTPSYTLYKRVQSATPTGNALPPSCNRLVMVGPTHPPPSTLCECKCWVDDLLNTCLKEGEGKEGIGSGECGRQQQHCHCCCLWCMPFSCWHTLLAGAYLAPACLLPLPSFPPLFFPLFLPFSAPATGSSTQASACPHQTPWRAPHTCAEPDTTIWQAPPMFQRTYRQCGHVCTTLLNYYQSTTIH